MIYTPNIEPLVLTEADADSFLESVGIELFETTLSINGVMYNGTYGESILAKNGIFLYEDGIILEGPEADKYRARKAEEQRIAKSKDESLKDNHRRRINANSDHASLDRATYKVASELSNRHNSAADAYQKVIKYYRDELRGKNDGSEYGKLDADFERKRAHRRRLEDNVGSAVDAAYRKQRREEKKKKNSSTVKESTIFDNVEII